MNSHKVRRLAGIFAGGVLLLSLAGAAGCDDDGEDRPEVDVIDEDGTRERVRKWYGIGSSSGSGVVVEPGVVEDKPDGATQLNVEIGEWFVTPENSTVASGQIYFLVDNQGPEDPHEFVIIKTDEPADQLPDTDGKVPEDQVDLLDEIEPFAPNSQASIALDLEPGNYALICNIAEEEEGQLESHYGEGMYSALTVE